MRIHRIMFLGIVLLLQGCEAYHAQPLSPTNTLASVERSRLLEAESGSVQPEPKPEEALFSFGRAAALMRTHAPALEEIRAEYNSAEATARVKTPLPNPTLEVGPQYGFGADVLTHRFQPFGSLGFSIPTGRRLTRQDEVDQARAEAAFVEVVARHRELYMQLRKAYSRFVLDGARLTTRRVIAESAKESLGLTRRAEAAGQVSGVDVVLFELDEARLRAGVIDSQSGLTGDQNDLAELIGISIKVIGALPEKPLPDLAPLPGADELKRLLIENHPELARLRAKYEVAEHELHLEIAKQYPDFRFGPSANGDVGDRKTTLGLTLGIDVPIFDRNQQGIAAAKAKRDELRIKFEAALNRQLAELEKALQAYEYARERSALFTSTLLPKSKEGMDLAQKAFDKGATDLLRYLETQRSQRAIELDAVDAEIAGRNAYVDVEQAVGCPLLTFPGETPEVAPPPGNINGIHVITKEKQE